MRIVEDLIKKEVVNSDIMIIGKVTDIILDEDTMEITDIVVKKTGISESLKSSNGENVVPIDMIKVIGDKIILKGNDDI